MTSILLGYDIGIISGAKRFIKEDFDLSDVRCPEGRAVACLSLACLAASLIIM